MPKNAKKTERRPLSVFYVCRNLELRRRKPTARDFARAFYHSREWKRTREAYLKHRHGLCERCLSRGYAEKGEIVHHRRHLTPENIGDPSVTLSFDNLELLCRKCHAEEHPEIYGGRWETRVGFDADGNVYERRVRQQGL